jgi:hypothetical protein
MLSAAEQTINTAISTRQQPSGQFTPPAGDTQPSGIATIFFGLEFGTVYHQLAAVLDQATRARWQSSLAAAADYLARTGNLTWYSNGNINLSEITFFWLVWQATGNTKYERDYNSLWKFTLHPPQNEFPGSGLVVVKAPTKADGSDGMGYLTETGAGGTGFDASYTSTQLDNLCRLYLLSRDPRVLYLANLEINMLLPRINSSFVLNISSGTRHTEANAQAGIMTSSFAVLGLVGGRTDLASKILPYLNVLESWYNVSGQADTPVYRRGLATDVSMIALAAGSKGGKAPVAKAPRRIRTQRKHAR